jgi:hypothetical protein
LKNIARSKLKFDISEKINENIYLKEEIEKIMNKFSKIEKSKDKILYVEDKYINIYIISYLKLNRYKFTKDNFIDIFNEKSNFTIF